MIIRVIPLGLLAAYALAAAHPELERAHKLFDAGQYETVIRTLATAQPSDAPAQLLIGKSWFTMREFKKAIEAFERATAAEPGNSSAWNWLGKAWGRRAETSNMLLAPGYASKARQHFEKAVQLNPRNLEAVSDLLDYYLEAPGFLGGGMDKAEALAAKIKPVDAAEYQQALARIAEKKKDPRAAEQHLRAALELEPGKAGRVIDLGRFLSKQGRTAEAEEVFARAAKLAPDEPRLLFERANNLVRGKQNLEQARAMLERYMRLPLSPDDPPREEARKLLKAAGA